MAAPTTPAILIDRLGPPEVLVRRDVPLDDLDPDCLQLEVHAAGVNFADLLQRAGLYGTVPRRPFSPGFEVAGEVVRIGAAVKHWRVGDRAVALLRHGGYARDVVVTERQAFRYPDGLTPVQAAAVPVVFLTAWVCLFEAARARAGETVLILGAGGGVGTAAVQLAVQHRLKVIGTAGSPRKREFVVAELGAEACVDSRGDWEAEVRKLRRDGVNIALDAVGGRATASCRRLMSPLGRLVVYGLSGAMPGRRRSWLRAALAYLRTPRFHPLWLVERNMGVFGVQLLHLWDQDATLRPALAEIFRGVVAGELRPVIAFAIPDAVRILAEVADALGHAHAHGVVHRDIKPGNVLLSGRHALVADFGVAKAVTEATGHQTLTSAGVALGTPAYMAPEQAVADSHQDHRVDIYAVGVLGYELLTGRVPFSATTAQDMLAAHVTADPEPLERHRPDVAPALAQVVMKCLAKKPTDRWQTAEELLHSLELFATPSGGMTPAQTAPTGGWRRPRRWALWAMGVAGVAAIILAANKLVKPRPLNITASDMSQVTNGPGIGFQPAISPDGNEVAYVAGPIAAPHLFVRSAVNVAGGAAVRLGDTALGSEWLPAWNPDGQSVEFLGCRGGRETDCAWKDVGKLGGSEQAVSLPAGAASPAWSPDGAHVAFVRGDTIFAMSAADTTLRRKVPTEPAELHSLAWSPDGRLLAYVNGNPGYGSGANIAGSSVWVVSVAGGEPRRVTDEDHLNASPVWLDARHLLFVSDRDGQRAVYAVEVGPRGARGEPRSIPGLADPHSISYSIASRRLAYAKFIILQNIWSYPLGSPTPISVRDGHPVTTGSLLTETHDVSPDGRWIVYSTNIRGHMDLFKMPVAGGQPVPLTSGPGGEAPRWSPDGKEIAFHTTALATNQVAVVAADGGLPVTVSSRAMWTGWPAWGLTGHEILFVSDQSGRWVTLEASREGPGGPWRDAVRVALRGVQEAAPDGRSLLCRVRSTLELRTHDGSIVWRRDLAATDRVRLIGGVKGSMRLSRDGRTVFVIGAREGRLGVWSVPVSGGAARLVVTFDDPAIVPFGWISVGPDRLYVTVSEYESDIWIARLRY